MTNDNELVIYDAEPVQSRFLGASAQIYEDLLRDKVGEALTSLNLAEILQALIKPGNRTKPSQVKTNQTVGWSLVNENRDVEVSKLLSLKVAGIGPKLAARLIERFKSFVSLKSATIAQLEEVKGIAGIRAKKIYETLHYL